MRKRKRKKLRVMDGFPPLCSGKSTFYRRTFPLVEMEAVINLKAFRSRTEKDLHFKVDTIWKEIDVNAFNRL